MHAPPPPGSESSLPITSVRVYRVGPDQCEHFWMLSPSIDGCLTHFIGGYTRYCPGDRRPCQNHKKETYWKGYVAALRFDEPSKLWLPEVLEITERLEIDMRDRYERGQVWKLTRAKELTKKKMPVRGRLVQERDPDQTEPAFDILPALRSIFHDQDIVLGVPNPLPMPVHVEVVNAAPPPGLEGSAKPAAVSQSELRAIAAGGGFWKPKNGVPKED